MKRRVSLKSHYYRWRGRIGRIKRLIFMSPAEARLIELMGGRCLKFGWPKSRRTKFPFILVVSRGKLFKNEHVKREVRIGKYYVDFGNDLGRAIEVDGDPYHMDILADLKRDGYLMERGWRVKHIPAHKLLREPDKIQRDVLSFLLD